MEFNKTKRTIEKVAGILSTIFYSLFILSFFVFLIISTSIYGGYLHIPLSSGGIHVSVWLLVPIPIISIIPLILSTKLIKSPLQPDGSVKPRNGIRITLLVFSILDALWVTSVLLIIVLCMKDFKDPTAQNSISIGFTKSQTYSQTTEGKIAEVKRLKELGVIDDATFEKAIKKITDDLLR